MRRPYESLLHSFACEASRPLCLADIRLRLIYVPGRLMLIRNNGMVRGEWGHDVLMHGMRLSPQYWQLRSEHAWRQRHLFRESRRIETLKPLHVRRRVTVTVRHVTARRVSLLVPPTVVVSHGIRLLQAICKSSKQGVRIVKRSVVDSRPARS